MTDKEIKEVEQELNIFADKIEEYVTYGTSILNDIGQRQGQDENYVAFMLFRHFLELTDSVSILVRNSSIDPCMVILRTMVETSLSLEYLIKEDFNRRAYAYLVAEACKEKKLLLKLIEGTLVAKQLEASLKKDRLLAQAPAIELPSEDAQKQIDVIDALLQRPGFAEAFVEYQNITSTKKEKNPAWYSYWGGPTNLEGVAQNVGKTGYYEFYYRIFSNSVHASATAKQKIRRENGQMHIMQIRDFSNAKQIVQNTLVFVFDTFLFTADHLIPSKKRELAQWYVDNVQGFFLSLNQKQWP